MNLSEERLMIKEMAADFTNQVVIPTANKLDKEKGLIPMELRDQMAELGFFGIKIPEEYGGMGLGCFEYCLVAEELSRGWMSVASIIARANTSFDYMSEEWRREFLPKSASGEFLFAAALSEPNVGSDLSGISCKAELDGDEWVINGSKYWVTFADGADAIFLAARTDQPTDPKRKYDGISLFLVHKERGKLPPNSVGTPVPKIGYFGWNTYELSFDNCRLPKDALLGERGKGFKILASGLEVPRAHTAARSIGLAQGALDVAVQYSQERVQFGRPIAKFQDLRFKIARCATKIETARQLMYSVCEKIDQGGRCDKESSMVKYYAAEIAEEVTSDCLQILGGAGYTNEFPVERYWRDARLTKIFEGTSEIQLRIISDRILGR